MPTSVEDIIQELEDRLRDNPSLCRGQSRTYPPKENRVCSTLARILPEEQSDDLERLEEKLWLSAIPFCSPHTREIEIMADLRHFGVLTNLIDFTKDIRIALFFACFGNQGEDGKLFFLRLDRGRSYSDLDRRGFPLFDSLQLDGRQIFQNFYTANNASRAIQQRSVLVRAPGGHIDFEENKETYPIPKERKQEILDYLANQTSPIKLYSLFPKLVGLVALGLDSEPKSLKAFEKSLDDLIDYCSKLLPQDASDYNKGRWAFFNRRYEEAVEHFLAVQKSQHPVNVDFLRFLSSALLRIGRYQDTINTLASIPRDEWADEEYYMDALSKQGLKDFSEALSNIKEAMDNNRFRSAYHFANMQIAAQVRGPSALHSARHLYETTFNSIADVIPWGPGAP